MRLLFTYIFDNILIRMGKINENWMKAEKNIKKKNESTKWKTSWKRLKVDYNTVMSYLSDILFFIFCVSCLLDVVCVWRLFSDSFPYNIYSFHDLLFLHPPPSHNPFFYLLNRFIWTVFATCTERNRQQKIKMNSHHTEHFAYARWRQWRRTGQKFDIKTQNK